MTKQIEEFLKTATPESIMFEYENLCKRGLVATVEERDYRRILGQFIRACITEGRQAGINSLPEVK